MCKTPEKPRKIEKFNFKNAKFQKKIRKNWKNREIPKKKKVEFVNFFL